MMAANPMQVEFVFVHSYRSDAPNWRAVMQGDAGRAGRLRTARAWADRLGVPVLANDRIDTGNHALYARDGVTNLATALRTEDEVRSALAHSRTGRVLFVSSPDHLPRVARDAMKLGGTGALFAASEVPHSTAGAAGVMISEPSDLTARDGGQNALANMGVSCKTAPDGDVETTE